jgi:hypothetical protein
MARKPTIADHLPAYQVETWEIDRIRPFERNARKHPKSQIEQLRASLRKYGQVWPLLVRPDGTLIAGHGRIEAAKAEGFQTVNVIVAKDWSEEQCRAFAILDNKVALNSEWDMDALSAELNDLFELEGSLDDLGFTQDELEDILSPDEPSPPKQRDSPSGVGNPVIQFNIIFDDEQQQQRWFAFIRELKTLYPDEDTLGARLDRFLMERPGGED